MLTTSPKLQDVGSAECTDGGHYVPGCFQAMLGWVSVSWGDRGYTNRVLVPRKPSQQVYMGGCQNYGPFLDPYYHPKRDPNFDNRPHRGLLALGFSRIRDCDGGLLVLVLSCTCRIRTLRCCLSQSLKPFKVALLLILATLIVSLQIGSPWAQGLGKQVRGHAGQGVEV